MLLIHFGIPNPWHSAWHKNSTTKLCGDGRRIGWNSGPQEAFADMFMRLWCLSLPTADALRMWPSPGSSLGNEGVPSRAEKGEGSADSRRGWEVRPHVG